MNVANEPKKQSPARLTLVVDSAELEAGRAYRLAIAEPGAKKRGPAPFIEIRIGWDVDQPGGDEFFPFPKKSGTWRAPVQSEDGESYIEFRAPGKGNIRFTAIPRRADEPAGDNFQLELDAIAPAVPPTLLRPLSGVISCAQDRVSLLDTREWARELVPLPEGRPAARHHHQARARLKSRAVAFVGSRELREELAFDCDLTAIDDRNWAHRLRPGGFDYLLIEPVLHVDEYSWRYAMVRSGDIRPMQDLLRHCRQIGLPVVLWLRTEPEMYGEFAWMIPSVDLVYAIDPAIQRMVAVDHPKAQVHLLPPCVQPRLHNPIGTRSTLQLEDGLSSKVLLDGWWKLSGASRTEFIRRLRLDRLLVTESEWEFSYTRLNSAPDIRWNTVGCIDRTEKALLSRLVGAELFLVDEATPAWRRDQMMLRSAASGSIVLFRNEGLRSLMIDEGLCWHGGDDLLLSALPALVDRPLDRARWRHRVSRNVLDRHTYRARLDRIARDLGLEGTSATRKVACLLVTMRPWLLNSCIERFGRDIYPEKELIVVIHGEGGADKQLAALAGPNTPIQIHRMSKARSLGACLNFAAQQTDAPFWAKIDDDDIYGPGYLSDMMLYQGLADSSLVAKPPAFIYVEDRDELRWHPVRGTRSWLHYPSSGTEATAGVAGGTLFGKQSVLEETPFSELRRGGSDSHFVRQARDAGHHLLVADPFNFAFFRSNRPGFHTWDTDVEKLRSDSILIGGAQDFNSALFV